MPRTIIGKLPIYLTAAAVIAVCLVLVLSIRRSDSPLAERGSVSGPATDPGASVRRPPLSAEEPPVAARAVAIDAVLPASAVATAASYACEVRSRDALPLRAVEERVEGVWSPCVLLSGSAEDAIRVHVELARAATHVRARGHAEEAVPANGPRATIELSADCLLRLEESEPGQVAQIELIDALGADGREAFDACVVEGRLGEREFGVAISADRWNASTAGSRLPLRVRPVRQAPIDLDVLVQSGSRPRFPVPDAYARAPVRPLRVEVESRQAEATWRWRVVQLATTGTWPKKEGGSPVEVRSAARDESGVLRGLAGTLGDWELGAELWVSLWDQESGDADSVRYLQDGSPLYLRPGGGTQFVGRVVRPTITGDLDPVLAVAIDGIDSSGAHSPAPWVAARLRVPLDADGAFRFAFGPRHTLSSTRNSAAEVAPPARLRLVLEIAGFDPHIIERAPPFPETVDLGPLVMTRRGQKDAIRILPGLEAHVAVPANLESMLVRLNSCPDRPHSIRRALAGAAGDLTCWLEAVDGGPTDTACIQGSSVIVLTVRAGVHAEPRAAVRGSDGAFSVQAPHRIRCLVRRSTPDEAVDRIQLGWSWNGMREMERTLSGESLALASQECSFAIPAPDAALVWLVRSEDGSEVEGRRVLTGERSSDKITIDLP